MGLYNQTCSNWLLVDGKLTNGRDALGDLGSFRYLSKQGGGVVSCYDETIVFKTGDRVRRGEEVAMRLVARFTAAPVPTILLSFTPSKPSLGMSFIPGITLKSVWDGLDENTKERICRQIWAYIDQWRQIPRPPELSHLYQCLADGSADTDDPLLKDLDCPSAPLKTDEEVRLRIFRRYWHYNGRRYAGALLDMLPRSQASVFTHGDIAPRNILVDRESFELTGFVDWEHSGWYPDYWEYANIMKPSVDRDWQRSMDLTAPQRWDIGGIVAARRVLF